MKFKKKERLSFWFYYIVVFLFGVLIGWLLLNRPVAPVGIVKANEVITCASQCIASECGTTEGLKYEVQESYEYANGICPLWYHWQNNGNWSQNCHRDYNWMHPEHKSATGCPAGFDHVGNDCRKSVFNCEQVSCDCAEIIPCAGECPTACGLEASTVPDGKGGEMKCDATEACPLPPPPVVQDHSGPVAAPQCEDSTPLVLPSNVHVVRNGTDATVNFFTSSSNANIYYRDIDSPVWQYSARDIQVTGGYVSYTIHDLKIGVGYTFGVEAANSCAGSGKTVLAVVVDGPKSFTFPMNYWEWKN